MIQKKPLSQKDLRLRYIRVLEKFVKRAINLLKAPEEDFHFEKFKVKMNDNFEFVKKVEAVRLDSGYMSKLECYVNIILGTLECKSEDYQDNKSMLLKEANLLHKEKNKAVYKKDKHSKHKFNDGY